MNNNLLNRVTLEVKEIYDTVNCFNYEHIYLDFASMFSRDERAYPLEVNVETKASNKTEKEVFECSLKFIKFLESTGDFECVYCSPTRSENQLEMPLTLEGFTDYLKNAPTPKYIVLPIADFEERIIKTVLEYGYDSDMVLYDFILRRKSGKDKITPPEHIPDEILELFQPKESN